MPDELFAIIEDTTKNPNGKSVRNSHIARIRVGSKLLAQLIGAFKQMSLDFLSKNSQVSDFDGRYTAQTGELSRIPNFPIPSYIKTACSNPTGCPDLDLALTVTRRIKAIFAYEDSAKKRLLFQAFKPNQILLPKNRWAIWDFNSTGTLTQVQQSVLTFGPSVDAIHDGSDLLFRNYPSAHSFLDLSEYYRDATSEEMQAVLSTGPLVSDNLDAYIESASIATRKKFFTIEQTEILKKTTAEMIHSVANDQGLSLELRKDAKGNMQVVIPEKPSEARELIDLLCQTRFFGPLTGELMISNSVRPAGDQKKAATATAPAAVAPKKAAKKVAPKAAAKSAKKKPN